MESTIMTTFSSCPVTLFDHFVAASTFKTIQSIFNQMCTLLRIDQLDESASFYQNLNFAPKLTNIMSQCIDVICDCLKCGLKSSWKAQKLWTLLDKRVAQEEYCNQRVCNRMHVLVVGAGPCGLRAAIECALLGARVIVVEKRERFSRYNVLHIWPFVIQDLKNLGAKILYPKFCAGSIDHISIRQLQCILLKVSLILGVQVNEAVSFCSLVEPRQHANGQVTGWRASFLPADHFLCEYEFVALIGADGKRNTIPGFERREMRGKLALGITANFVNRRSHAEEKVAEISGVAFIFNQQFFKDMKSKTGIDLENIVYYKDETHYFVMTAKKQSLIDKRVLKSDFDDISSLLNVDNIDQIALTKYAREAAEFSTEGQMPHLDYALNHFGEPDVAMFDFTSLFSAQSSIRFVERCNRCLLMSIVGDSLHEPFWPTGSGCARGFLGVFDTVWLLREFGAAKRGTMQLIAERESTYRLLTQATPENLQRNFQKYSIDPRTRYTSFDSNIRFGQVSHLVDTDNPRHVPMEEIIQLVPLKNNDDVFIRRYRLLRACQQALALFKIRMHNLSSCWTDGRALTALIARSRPHLIDYAQLNAIASPRSTMLTKVFTVIRAEFGIESPCKAEDWPPNDARLFDYLQRLIDRFAAERPVPTTIISTKTTQKRKSTRVNVEKKIEKSPEMYQPKQRHELMLTRKMDPKVIEELEKKFEQGVQDSICDQFTATSSKEEKIGIVRIKPVEARKATETGFSRQSDKDKYKDIDEKLNKAYALIKNQKNVAGIDISRTVQQRQQLTTPLRSKRPVLLSTGQRGHSASSSEAAGPSSLFITTTTKLPTTSASMTRIPERAEFKTYRQPIGKASNNSRRHSINDDEVEERTVQLHNLGYVDDEVYSGKADDEPKRQSDMVKIGASEEDVGSSTDEEDEKGQKVVDKLSDHEKMITLITKFYSNLYI